MFRSIRWTLLFWYAVIIVGSLAALGWVLLTEMERTLYRDADAQLAFWMETVANRIEDAPPGGLEDQIARALPPGAVFAVWGEQGRRTAASPGYPPAGLELEAHARPLEATTVTWGHMRGSVRRRPGSGRIFVAANVRDQHHRIREFLIVLLCAGAAILVVALGGGWILIGRALAPVERIASAASRISADNLGERIDTERIHNELGGLARTLNASFDRLEAAFERQARFTADASHELRTPLAIALSHLELASTGPQTEEQLRERIAIVQVAARRMRSVVEGLLTLARADAGEARVARVDVDLRVLLEEVRASMVPLAAERGITVEHDLEAVTIRGDVERLHEAVTNLYTNAVGHGHQDGRVFVTLRREDNAAVLRVADTGPGIPQEHLPHIFDRFYRVDAARAGVGSGLGLAITRWIVELHGGSIDAASRPGEGAVFTVRLPVS